jgi:hypothetical protein
VTEPTRPSAPDYDPNLATRLVGKYVLVGITFEDASGKIASREQCHGVVARVDQTYGIEIALKGLRLGGAKRFPPSTSVFNRLTEEPIPCARPGRRSPIQTTS